MWARGLWKTYKRPVPWCKNWFFFKVSWIQAVYPPPSLSTLTLCFKSVLITVLVLFVCFHSYDSLTRLCFHLAASLPCAYACGGVLNHKPPPILRQSQDAHSFSWNLRPCFSLSHWFSWILTQKALQGPGWGPGHERGTALVPLPSPWCSPDKRQQQQKWNLPTPVLSTVARILPNSRVWHLRGGQLTESRRALLQKTSYLMGLVCSRTRKHG